MRKKVLAMFILCFTLSCVTALAWDNTKTDSREIARNVLKILDIMDGNTSINHKDEDVITRGELADTVMRLSGTYNAKSYTFCFEDVSEDTEYADSISTLVSMGVIAQDENFNPKAPAKYEHAVKMILYLLGYESLIENNSNGDVFELVLKQADSVKLTKDIQAKRGENLNSGMLLALCFNALDCEIIEKDHDNSLVRSKDKTLLSEKFDIYKEKGIVKATSITSLTGASLVGSVTIGDLSIYDENGIANDYLGMEVNAYYYSGNNHDNELIYVYPTSRNKTLKIKADKLLTDEAGFGYETIYYEVDKSNKKEKAKIDGEADVIYNGKAYPSYTIDDYKIDMGYLRFVDNDSDSDADVVFIEEYENYVADLVNSETKKIYDMYGKILNFEDVDVLNVKDMYGSKMEISQISRWNVLSVKTSKDEKLINITVYDDPVTGEVERISTEDNKRYITIDGDTFAVSKSYEAALKTQNVNAKEIVLSQSAIYYLDENEKIAAVRLESDPSWRYAYLIKVFYDENEETAGFKLIYDNTGAKSLVPAENIRVDGKLRKNGEIAAYFADASGKTIPQLIKFISNGNGEVKEIDTVVLGAGETSENLKRTIDNQTGYWSVRTRRAGNGESIGVQVDHSKTLIFQVPESFEDRYDYEKYSIRTSEFENNEKITYDAYDVDATGLAKVVVIEKDDYSADNYSVGNMLIITKVYEMIDSDNENYTVMTGLNCAGKEVTLNISDSVDISQLSIGDLVVYALDYKGIVSKFIYLFDNETGTAQAAPSKLSIGDTDIGTKFLRAGRLFNATNDYLSAYTGNAPHYLLASVIVDKIGSFIKTFKPGIEFATGDADDFNQIQIFEQTCPYYSSAKAVVFLCRSNKVRIIDWDDLEEYIYSRNSNARALMYSTYTQLRAVYIYE